MSVPPGVVTLPPGVQVSAGRETSQLGPNNQTVPGMVFNLTLPSGATTSLFVPNAILPNTDAVAQLFANRVASIQAVEGLSTTGY